MNEPYALGIDLGGSSVKAVALSVEAEPLAELNRSFDPEARLHFAETVASVRDSLVQARGYLPAALGLCAPGLPAKDKRSIAYLPNRLPGLEGLNWKHYLRSDLPVSVLNDAQAALLGEVWRGAARGRTNILLLTLGTGVGGAAMVDGHLLHGHVGRAGHVGHISLDPTGTADICGTPGSLELAIGNVTIQERTRGKFATTHELVAAYRRGDTAAADYWLASVRALAAGIVSLANVLDPELVVIGGGIAAAGEALFQPLRQLVAQFEWAIGNHRLQIVPAQLGDKAGACGAAHHALSLTA